MLDKYWDLVQLTYANWADRLRKQHDKRFRDSYKFMDSALEGANPFKALGLDNHATLKEVKAKYRELAKICHPDKVEGKEEDFKAITESYNTIKELLA